MSGDRHRLGVLVADDSPVARRLIVQILGRDPRLRVVAEAADGDEAVELATRHRPDVIVMDVVMPSVDGMEATRRIMEVLPTPIVLVSSTHDPTDVNMSFQALQAGALTLVAKPSGPRAGTFEQDAAALAVTVRLMADVKLIRRRRVARPHRELVAAERGAAARSLGQPVEIVAIAASTGGPAALATIFGSLPTSLPVPILVVQHIPPGFDEGLVQWLDSVSPVPVRLARDREPLQDGTILVAPADSHLGVTRGGRVALSCEPPIGSHRPSANHLFGSAAAAYGAGAVGAILTGMGVDGAAGLRLLKNAGGLVLAQDEPTSVVYGMPGRAASMGIVDQILPVERIAGALIAACNGRKA